MPQFGNSCVRPISLPGTFCTNASPILLHFDVSTTVFKMRSQVLRAGQVANCRVSCGLYAISVERQAELYLYLKSSHNCAFTHSAAIEEPATDHTQPRLPPFSPQRRPRLAHPAVPEAPRASRRSAARAGSRAATHARGEDPVRASREPGGVAAVGHEQWARCAWTGEPEAQTGSRGDAGCKCADGAVAVYELWARKDGGAG
jgi:hypothetical protein